MVVSVDGTKISLVEMDADSMSGKNFAEGERPERPEGVEGFQGFGDFNPEDFGGTMPEGGNFPQWGDGQMPEMPEGMTLPEGMPMPEDGEMPSFGGREGIGSGFESLASSGENVELDLGNAHISVETDGGKESGSMDNIQVGTFVTVTIDGKGNVTYVLVSSRSGFSGGRRTSN